MIPHQPDAWLLIIRLAKPVYFEVDLTRTPQCRILVHGRAVQTIYHGQWRVAKMTGLANDQDGSITSRGFTLDPINIDKVRSEWRLVSPEAARELRARIRLFTAGGWDVNESVRLPDVAKLRCVTEAEFLAADSVCDSSEAVS